VDPIKEPYHPNAYLHHVKSVKRGLAARTKILNLLETATLSAGNLAQKSGLSYVAVLHHLRLLERGGAVRRKSGRPSLWELTGSGQKRLVV
jgi:predicted ArsR family transcriptional regulator